jgi:hypothetical protein
MPHRSLLSPIPQGFIIPRTAMIERRGENRKGVGGKVKVKRDNGEF